MSEVKILLDTIDKVKSFVATTIKLDVELDLVSGRYVIDAKSILGIFSMDLSKPLLLQIHAKEDEAEEILEMLREYAVE